MYINGEGIEVLHQPAAHTDGDSVVFFRRSDVVVAGDVIDTTRFPMIDVARGGSIQGEIDALNRIVDLAIPSIPFDWRDEGTLVIPGHGRLFDQLDVVEYRDMVVIIRDRIRAMLKQGKSLEQVKAASPTQGYTRRYGADSGPWTTSMFVEAIYTSLESSETSPRSVTCESRYAGSRGGRTAEGESSQIRLSPAMLSCCLRGRCRRRVRTGAIHRRRRKRRRRSI